MEDLTELLETHFEITDFIVYQTENEESPIYKVYESKGRGGLWELSKKWTEEFTYQYKSVVWGQDFDWIETLETFLLDKLNEI